MISIINFLKSLNFEPVLNFSFMDKNIKRTNPKAVPPQPPKVTISAAAASAKPPASAPKPTGEFAFGRENYMLLLIGLVFIIAGFLLMIGGGSKDPKVFNPDIFSFRRITLAPILILAGYIIEIFAIMRKPKE
jgi:hypothetical protein